MKTQDQKAIVKQYMKVCVQEWPDNVEQLTGKHLHLADKNMDDLQMLMWSPTVKETVGGVGQLVRLKYNLDLDNIVKVCEKLNKSREQYALIDDLS